MKFEIPRIIELDINPASIYLGIRKNFGFNLECDFHQIFSLGIVIKGVVFSVWKFYTGDKWTRLCFRLGRKSFAIRIS